uniref:40S ribosomal protein S30 n=1 Tax=Panthera leo TaxID=9689 RepID=A0A8C8WES7_PANLE
KVRGSLVRAGKVRGRTPKVAKQEKTKTGRVKQGTQYNLHFFYVVPTFGKKKSPTRDSNS